MWSTSDAVAVLHRDAGFSALSTAGLAEFNSASEPGRLSALPEYVRPVYGALARAGKLAAVVDASGSVHAWDTAAGKKLWSRTKVSSDTSGGWNGMLPISFNDSGSRLLLVTNYRAYVVDASTGRDVCQFERVDQVYQGMTSFFRHNLIVTTSMLFTNGTGVENRYLHLIDHEKCVALGPAPSLENLFSEENVQQGFGYGVRFDLSGLGWIGDRKAGSRFVIRRYADDSVIGTVRVDGRVLSILAVPERGMVIISDQAGNVQFHEEDTFRMIGRVHVGDCPVTTLHYDEKVATLLAGCPGGPFRMWALPPSSGQRSSPREWPVAIEDPRRWPMFANSAASAPSSPSSSGRRDMK